MITASEVSKKPGAVQVNPTDTSLRNGARAEALRKDPPPYIPGMDAAGVIDEMGAGTATDLAVGDAVMAMVIPTGSHGAYRESIVLAADSVARAPAGSTHVEAATLPMNGLTARQSLDQLALQPGQTVAVTGAAGCYGGYVVQLAKTDGLRVIADASSADEPLVRNLGADVVVPRGDDITAQIRKVAPDGVDGLADGAVQSELAVGAVGDGGTFASVRGWGGTGERWDRLPQNDGARIRPSSRSARPPAPAGRGRAHHPSRRRNVRAGGCGGGPSPPRGRRHPRPLRDRVIGSFRSPCQAEHAPFGS